MKGARVAPGRAGPNAVFIDTFALVALINRSDAAHARADSTMRTLGETLTPLVTSQWVLTEFLATCSRAPLRAAAATLADTLIASPLSVIVPAAAADWTMAFTTYKGHADKSWSLADCASMLICRRLRIKRVLTQDRHFVQAGFEILL